MSHQEKKRKHINSFQSLNDVIHWSPSIIQELGHPVAPTGGEQVADACSKTRVKKKLINQSIEAGEEKREPPARVKLRITQK
ncbi:hypothetical protein TNCV_3898631 [Trichonephila clavipes]|nr:hypothetical protein TNCV_3898631 [Trichonephila clavipes]